MMGGRVSSSSSSKALALLGLPPIMVFGNFLLFCWPIENPPSIEGFIWESFTVYLTKNSESSSISSKSSKFISPLEPMGIYYPIRLSSYYIWFWNSAVFAASSAAFFLFSSEALLTASSIILCLSFSFYSFLAFFSSYLFLSISFLSCFSFSKRSSRRFTFSSWFFRTSSMYSGFLGWTSTFESS